MLKTYPRYISVMKILHNVAFVTGTLWEYLIGVLNLHDVIMLSVYDLDVVFLLHLALDLPHQAAIIAEVIEIARDSNEYMLDRWSVLDFVAFQCCLAAFIFRLVDAESSWGQSLYAVAAPLLFWRLLFYAQILPFQGAMVQVTDVFHVFL